MLARSKEQDMVESIRGPVGLAAIAIILIAGGFAVAEEMFAPDADEAPDEKPLFGDFIVNTVDEIVYYLKWAAYLAVIGGVIMIGTSLRIHLKDSKISAWQR